MIERSIQENIRHELSRGPVRLFRNNVGMGWAGGASNRRVTRVTADNLDHIRWELRPGDVIVPAARPLHAGLQEGSADLIGWRSMIIIPPMVGQTVAVFASVEVKSLRGTAQQAQINWAEQVKTAGGIAGVARSVEAARSLLG